MQLNDLLGLLARIEAWRRHFDRTLLLDDFRAKQVEAIYGGDDAILVVRHLEVHVVVGEVGQLFVQVCLAAVLRSIVLNVLDRDVVLGPFPCFAVALSAQDLLRPELS